MRRKAALLTLCLASSSFGLAGCSSLAPKGTKKGSDVKIWSPSTWFVEEYQKPASLAVIWTPDILAVAGQPPQRGFGGRVFFYNDKMQAVPVEGDLTIHGFDGMRRKTDPQAAVADKKFSFSSEQLVSHFSPSELGASYSIWVPWDNAGGDRQEVNLVATFKSDEGAVVQGAPAKLVLEGSAPDGLASKSLKTPMQTVSYRHSVTPSNQPQAPSSLRTTTISVPKSSTLTRRRNFTLGDQLNSKPQSVQIGASGDALKASSITVGGGARPRVTESQPVGGNEPARSTIPTLNVEGLKVQGLSPPPMQVGGRGPIAADNTQQGVVPASFSK